MAYLPQARLALSAGPGIVARAGPGRVAILARVEGLTRQSLKPLLELQRIDSAIDRLGQRRADLPEQRALDEHAAARTEIAAVHTERTAALEAVVRDQTRLEAEVAMLDDKIASESARLYSGGISNPKELSSIQAELDALRRRKAHVEDQLLDVLEAREAVEKEVGALAERLAELDRLVADATARRDTASVEIENELGELGAARGELRPTFPQEVLETYEDLRVRKNGIGAAALEGAVCRGCGVELTPMARDAIKRSDEALLRCENCRRILVIP